MSVFSRCAAVLLGVLVTLALAPASAAVAQGGRTLTATLTGANEAPGPGDPDGSGSATVQINPGLGTVCWTITVQGVDPITAAHIHVAPAGTAGPVVVPLSPYTAGCTEISRDLALAILQDPAAYYVNVHNATYPAGALRGQLSK